MFTWVPTKDDDDDEEEVAYLSVHYLAQTQAPCCWRARLGWADGDVKEEEEEEEHENEDDEYKKKEKESE